MFPARHLTTPPQPRQIITTPASICGLIQLKPGSLHLSNLAPVVKLQSGSAAPTSVSLASCAQSSITNLHRHLRLIHLPRIQCILTPNRSSSSSRGSRRERGGQNTTARTPILQQQSDTSTIPSVRLIYAPIALSPKRMCGGHFNPLPTCFSSGFELLLLKFPLALFTVHPPITLLPRILSRTSFASLLLYLVLILHNLFTICLLVYCCISSSSYTIYSQFACMWM